MLKTTSKTEISKRAFLSLCAAAGATAIGSDGQAQMPVNSHEILLFTLDAVWDVGAGQIETVGHVLVVGSQVSPACLATVQVIFGGAVYPVPVKLAPGTETWFWLPTEYDFADATELHWSALRFSHLQLQGLVGLLENAGAFTGIGHAPSGAVTWSRGMMDPALIAFGRSHRRDNWYLGFEATSGGYLVVFGTSAQMKRPATVPFLLAMLDAAGPMFRTHDTSDAEWIFDEYDLLTTPQSMVQIGCS